MVAHEGPQASRYVGGNIYDDMEIHVMTISMHEDFIHRAKSTSINLEIISTVENFRICDIWNDNGTPKEWRQGSNNIQM